MSDASRKSCHRWSCQTSCAQTTNGPGYGRQKIASSLSTELHGAQKTSAAFGNFLRSGNPATFQRRVRIYFSGAAGQRRISVRPSGAEIDARGQRQAVGREAKGVRRRWCVLRALCPAIDAISSRRRRQYASVGVRIPYSFKARASSNSYEEAVREATAIPNVRLVFLFSHEPSERWKTWLSRYRLIRANGLWFYRV
jgi:hypothetical protein